MFTSVWRLKNVYDLLGENSDSKSSKSPCQLSVKLLQGGDWDVAQFTGMDFNGIQALQHLLRHKCQRTAQPSPFDLIGTRYQSFVVIANPKMVDFSEEL